MTARGIIDLYLRGSERQVPRSQGAAMYTPETTEVQGFGPRVRAIGSLAAAPLVGLAYLAALPIAVPAMLVRQAWSQRREEAPHHTGVSRRAIVEREREKERAGVPVIRR